MNIYSLTCTRDENLSSTTTNLLKYFESCNIQTKLLTNQKSIFEAYDSGIDSLDADLDDIIILCHDDIEILTRPEVFTHLLKEKLSKVDTGFVGVAGAKILVDSAIWWDKQVWSSGKLRKGPLDQFKQKNQLNFQVFGIFMIFFIPSKPT